MKIIPLPRITPIRPGARRSFLRAGALCVVLLTAAISRGAAAQSDGSFALRQMYGDLAIEIWRAPQGLLRIGAADANRSIAIGVLARDLTRWADSANRVLTMRAPSRSREARWQAVVEGPGMAGGAMTLSRVISGSDTTISLFIADSAFVAVRTVVSAAEARALVAALRRVARTTGIKNEE